MKTTLFLKQNLPFAQNPRTVELKDEQILCNNIILPGEFNPHNVRLWVIGHEFGPVAAVWAGCEQDAFDELIDQGLGDCFLVKQEDYDAMSFQEQQETTALGNASEPCDLSTAWIAEVEFDKARDFDILIQLAKASVYNIRSLASI